MLEVSQLSKTYGTAENGTCAIADLTFTVEPGELLCIVGPSGCGKTTLLKMLSGLLSPTSGEVKIDGVEINGPAETLALVFQEYTRSLLPWMSVRDNVMLPLRHKGIVRAERERLADKNLTEVGLTGFSDKYPWQLSGGMQQRVAIARALAYEPEVLLMDEPFASVDAQTRSDLEDLVLQIHREFGITIVFVTHDIDESVYLADRVIVLGRPPTTVREIVAIDLPRQRDQVSTKELPRFAHLRAQILRLIRSGE